MQRREDLFKKHFQKLIKDNQIPMPNSQANRQQLDDVLRKNGLSYLPIDCKYHHVIPDNYINTLLEDLLTKDFQNTYSLLKNYYQKIPIFKRFVSSFGQRDPIEREKLIIDQVYAFVYWHKFNLVYGPSARSDDPKDGPEYKIIKLQTKNYSQPVNEIIKQIQHNKHNRKTLEKFLNLKNLWMVQWELNTDNNLWQVGNKMLQNIPGAINYIH